MTYIIGIAIATVMLIACVYVGKILFIFFAKNIAVSLAKKAVKSTTQYAKDQIQKKRTEIGIAKFGMGILLHAPNFKGFSIRQGKKTTPN